MLSCYRVINRVSKITRQANPRYIDQYSAKLIGGISGRHASDKKSAPGATLNVKDAAPKEENKPVDRSRTKNSCPPECEINCGAIPPNRPPDASIFTNYWKQIFAAVVLTSVAVYTLTRKSPAGNNKADDEASKKKTKTTATSSNKKKKREQSRYPAASVSLPLEVPYLLIGGGTAAFSAFRSIKSHDPKAKVLVIAEECDHPYMRPPLSKELWYNKEESSNKQLNFKQWNGTKRSLYYEPPEFYTKVEDLVSSQKGGVAVATGWKVHKIDPNKKIAILEDGYEIKYDKCLIATGASPKNLPVFEEADESVNSKIIPYRTKDDFLNLENRLNDPSINNVVIIGGGFLGSELACSIARNFEKTNKKVYQIYKENFVMSRVLPKYLSEWSTKKVSSEGVTCIANSAIKGIEKNQDKLTLVLTDDKKIDADQIIVAIGVEANTELAQTSNLEVDPKIGGFLVNAELEARKDLWVAGDAACFYDIKLGRRRVEHHDHAVISGRLAGENMTGAGKPYLHQSMFWSDLGPEVSYEAIGIVDSSLPTVGVFAKGEDDAGEAAAVSSQPEAKNTHLNVEGFKKVSPGTAQNEDDYEKGVVFYMKENVVVGIVLWNIFNRMSIARQVLARGTHIDEISEVAKLFTIHED